MSSTRTGARWLFDQGGNDVRRVRNWISKNWKKLCTWAVTIWVSLMIILFAPPIAAGFIGVPFTSHVENPYWKIVVGFFVGLAAYFLVVNLAEIALVLTAVQTKKLVEHFLDRVQENMPGAEFQPADQDLEFGQF